MSARRATGRARALLEIASFGLFASIAAIATPSCASIIGADDYDSIAIRVCQCETVSAIPDCAGRVEQALADATPEVREAWLANVEVHRCEEECGGAAACIDASPTCVPIGEACSVSVECCGAASPESGYLPSYCFDGECTRDRSGCLSTAQECSDPADCCGSSIMGADGAIGVCESRYEVLQDRCWVSCDPDNPTNCPTCCAVITENGVEAASYCASAIVGVGDFSCERVCRGDEDCPTGECLTIDLPLGPPSANLGVRMCGP